jgi:ABC-type uncharacterized transport system ATPase subunit
MLLQAVGNLGQVLLSETPLVKQANNLLLQCRHGEEHRIPPPRSNTADRDILQEEELVREYVEKYHQQTDDQGLDTEERSTARVALLIDSIVKTYPSLDFNGKPKYAVRGMSLACSIGERFGLLEINGAGKTTTLGILTGEIASTSGEIYIGDKPLSDPTIMQMIGYCPQIDPLLELMNAFETLWFFGRIRGISEDILQMRVQSLITQTGLTPHAHRPCGIYSGGNKRKLSLAVALIGDPKVLLLDEVRHNALELHLAFCN